MIVKYDSELGNGEIFIDLNKRAKIKQTPEKHNIEHFYIGFIPPFSVNTLSQEEMVAEKVAATIGRNKPRDHFDVYKILTAKIPINLDLVKKKCIASGDEFSIIKMFNKAKMLKNRWDKDMLPLLAEEIPFQTIMKFLAVHFKLKEEKEKIKKK
jgi:predicted nucleotidyltransferase component of viral defense system